MYAQSGGLYPDPQPVDEQGAAQRSELGQVRAG
jgi:hypothetical protein